VALWSSKSCLGLYPKISSDVDDFLCGLAGTATWWWMRGDFTILWNGPCARAFLLPCQDHRKRGSQRHVSSCDTSRSRLHPALVRTRAARMATHRRLDRLRVYLYAGELRKTWIVDRIGVKISICHSRCGAPKGQNSPLWLTVSRLQSRCKYGRASLSALRKAIPKPVETTVKVVFGVIGGILLAAVVMWLFAH